MANSTHPIVSPSAAARLDAARGRLTGIEPPILIVAASRGAADEFAFSLAAERGATFGVARVSLTELVAKLAVPALARRGLTPSAPLSDEAVAARVADDLLARDQLEYFTPVGLMPGRAPDGGSRPLHGRGPHRRRGRARDPVRAADGRAHAAVPRQGAAPLTTVGWRLGGELLLQHLRDGLPLVLYLRG